ncbi:MAG: ABC-F family ATP-binding cassette domain-containing protein [Lewinella sp.]|jgi:ATP-binding cassette subfamily F protein uup|uniref:ABC-F family ATP-binding cassette domain-containing protein n=1 Tax=Lewinella sp. TaxID=2004506 RepID=UPI003D6C5C39
MIYLELENVSKSYGEKVLFDKISLPVNKGNKVALVAKNGTGKSTLLRVAGGVDLPEGLGAKVYIHRDARMHYLVQEPDFGEEQTILDAIFEGDNVILKAIERYERALLIPDKADDLQKALSKMDELRAWDFEARIKEVLSKLKIDDLQKKIKNLSGGQRKRVALARLIIDDPDLIILDEPTNHLDLDMIEWLEEFLRQPNLTILMVTHDRYFLERVCDYIVELDQGELFKYSGNYSDFLRKKATRFEIEGNEYEKNKKSLKKELAWLNRQPKARGTKGKARVSSVLQLKDKVEDFSRDSELQIDIKGQRLGKTILEAYSVSKSYGDNLILKDFDYKFKKGERVGIAGPNGVGKSTFLHLLTQEERPSSGKIVVGGNTVFGYYTQDGIQLKEDQTVIEVIRDIAEYIPLEKGAKLTAEQLLERFMFPRPQQRVFVSQLSGGERRRLYLLTVLMKNPNFLILDEPTNDLDIMTLNVLEDFLMDFPGCIIIVSHDRFFLDKVVDHLFVFEGEGKIRDFLGSYSEYRVDQLERERAQRSEERKEEQQRKAEVEEQKPGLTQEQRKQIKRLENKISKLESKKTDITAAFNDTTLSAERITELSKDLATVKEEIEVLEMEWMELVDLA